MDSIFQSPLHRGRLFNADQRQPGRDRAHLSVPSSSGKTLQRRDVTAGERGGISFSPLFIGEDSSTWRLATMRGHTSSLSVPSSSGKTLQLASACGSDAITFSPLFIGEDSSTDADGLHEPTRDRHSLSVPSSSGKTLQLHLASDPFSPLFIGEDSSTIAITHTFQSPLHRGRLFNRSLSLALSVTCRCDFIRFSATPALAGKRGRFAKTPAERASDPSIRKYLRSSYEIRIPHSDSGPGLEEAKSHPESSHGFLQGDPGSVF